MYALKPSSIACVSAVFTFDWMFSEQCLELNGRYLFFPEGVYYQMFKDEIDNFLDNEFYTVQEILDYPLIEEELDELGMINEKEQQIYKYYIDEVNKLQNWLI